MLPALVAVFSHTGLNKASYKAALELLYLYTVGYDWSLVNTKCCIRIFFRFWITAFFGFCISGINKWKCWQP